VTSSTKLGTADLLPNVPFGQDLQPWLAAVLKVPCKTKYYPWVYKLAAPQRIEHSQRLATRTGLQNFVRQAKISRITGQTW